MASDKSVCDGITARLTHMGPVSGRSMFGGFGVFIDGLMFGLIADDALYLKVDEGNRAAYADADSEPFTHQGKSKPIELSYWKMPANSFLDEDLLVEWRSEAYSARNGPRRSK